MLKGIIERFEGKYAMVEIQNGNLEYIYKNSLPCKADVGDLIVIHENNHITLDTEGIMKRRKEIDTLANELFEDE